MLGGKKKKITEPLVKSLTLSLSHIAATENCTHQTVHQWLGLIYLLPSVDTGIGFSSHVPGWDRIIPLYDFVVLPKWEITPSSLPLPRCLCSPVQWSFSVDNCALPSASSEIKVSQIFSASLTSDKRQYGIIMETFKSWN